MTNKQWTHVQRRSKSGQPHNSKGYSIKDLVKICSNLKIHNINNDDSIPREDLPMATDDVSESKHSANWKGRSLNKLKELQKIKNPLGTAPYLNLLDNIEYYQDLKEIACDPNHNSESYIARLNNYLNVELIAYTRNISEEAVSHEKSVIDNADMEWLKQYDEIPQKLNSTSSIEKNIKQVQIKLKKFKKEIQDGHTQNEKQSREELDKLTTEYYTLLKKRDKINIERLKPYKDFVAEKLQENWFPKVYSLPDSPNFEYLIESISIISQNNTILFSIDVEAYEFNQDIVTEIGISIYDPRENVNNGMSIPIIRNYHLIVMDWFEIRNNNHVVDFKDCNIISESILLSMSNCVEFIQSLINYYMIPMTDNERTWQRAFVGHNIKGDLTWLQSIKIQLPFKLNYDNSPKMKSYNNMIYILDTERLHKILFGDLYVSLGKLLKLYDIPHSYLHNAGNDSYFTLILLLKVYNFHYRKIKRLDDLKVMGKRIQTLMKQEREMRESRTHPLPMSYMESVIQYLRESEEKTNGNNKESKRSNRDQKRRQDKIINPTEFHGIRWYSSAEEAFKSTV